VRSQATALLAGPFQVAPPDVQRQTRSMCRSQLSEIVIEQRRGREDF